MRFGVFIYDGTEPIDLATYGVLSMARRLRPEIEICTIAPGRDLVHLSNGLCVQPDYDLRSVPPLDVLIVTGGPGWQTQSRAAETLSFLRRQARSALVVCVCTGAMIAAASGILSGRRATTKRRVVAPEAPPIGLMRAAYPDIDVREASVIEDGVVTGGGVSLCIDTTLHVLARLFGAEMAAETARLIEYDRAWEANRNALPALIKAEALTAGISSDRA